ncbi:MAG TPA: dihydrofolate reductase family protein [Thermoanaerobaculia bacterium]|nr:dihydrofolate reductase family protein [Thermoanaerobaculia bacterium]
MRSADRRPAAATRWCGETAPGPPMTVDLLTVSWGRRQSGPAPPALSGLGLIESLAVPPQVLEFGRTLRRAYDAVLAGPNTVLLDNPALTSHAAPGQPCVRVTLDPAGKIPRHYRFLDGSARTVIGISRSTPAAYLGLLADRGIETVSGGDARVDLRQFLAALGRRGLRSLLVEGGGRLNWALLDGGLVRRVHLLIGPQAQQGGAVRAAESAPFGGLRLVDRVDLGGYSLLRYEISGPTGGADSG